MITITHEKIEQIPSLLVSNEDQQQKPVVVYFHGFTSSKEQNLSQAYYLAEKGFLVILPDSFHHGERATETDLMKIQQDFWKIVSANVSELHTIYAWVEQKGLMKDNQFGLAGTSMGGISTAAALTQYNWIQYAGIMMGSAKAQEMANYLIEGITSQGVELPFTKKEIEEQISSLREIDLSQQLDRLNGRPLFVWHGEDDQVVPFSHSTSFVDQLLEQQPEYPVQYVTEKGRDHKVSREAMIQLSNWFAEQVK
ncbi:MULTISPECIES: prolyl oligopeptidase family serine peptidase [Allobacillus]|uniref:Abhydrolase domain-containing 18 n=1 Tax=Allobacillus salarius TaxID=1955272 RepID=A0A556PMB0_9BACI|nr:prolyl oligopeptidase family serine peptidase [Allobacillus salarius]TSJ65533.1 abhydrolase domain-containing 18 [Allobacillus salarius]